MSKALVFITTSHIFHLSRWEKTDVLVGTLPDGEGREPYTVYTTGKLEQILADGDRPVVLSSRSRLMDHDTWWKLLLPEEDIHLLPTASREDGDSFTQACKKVVESVYGLTWPMEPLAEGQEEADPMFWTGALRVLNQKQQALKAWEANGPHRIVYGDTDLEMNEGSRGKLFGSRGEAEAFITNMQAALKDSASISRQQWEQARPKAVLQRTEGK